jgi:putative PIN family toxin of toxin-antitoxin system
MKVVLDTNVWLDWLLFADPRTTALQEAVRAKKVEVVIDADCEAELERVLSYRFSSKWPVDKPKLLAASRFVAKKVSYPGKENQLPRCADPDDQKFLELALAAGAACVLTRDEELLRLGKRTPFRILSPEEFQC